MTTIAEPYSETAPIVSAIESIGRQLLDCLAAIGSPEELERSFNGSAAALSARLQNLNRASLAVIRLIDAHKKLRQLAQAKPARAIENVPSYQSTYDDAFSPPPAPIFSSPRTPDEDETFSPHSPPSSDPVSDSPPAKSSPSKFTPNRTQFGSAIHKTHPKRRVKKKHRRKTTSVRPKGPD